MLRVLVIDDDSNFRSVLRQMLERCQIEVHEAPDGDVALSYLRKNQVDLVLSDLIMPEKDGIMAIQEILRDFPQMKIIAMSGGPRGNSAWLPIAKKIGALKTLRKPFSRDELLDAISSTVGEPT